MATREEIIEVLNNIILPGDFQSLRDLNAVQDITINGQQVEVKLAGSAIKDEIRQWLQERIGKTAGTLPGVTAVSVTFAATARDFNKITHIIAVMSGKGGVGKSLVSGLAAIALRRRGHSVGILDADITGPSIPRMFGLRDRPAYDEAGIVPLSSSTGIRVMSLNLLLPSEDEAVIWRGPIIGKVITQFWEEVLWGELEYLIIDLPPGTADAPLTVLQQIPVTGIIIVSSPQELATMIVKKAVKMATVMKKPIIGVIENMSYLYVPEIDKKIELFGPSRGNELANSAAAPLLARLPVDTHLAALCDQGAIESYQADFVGQLGESLETVTMVKK